MSKTEPLQIAALLQEAWPIPGPAQDLSYRLVKRACDIAVSSVALLVLAPVLAVIAVLIKLDSRGPVFYRQPRVGRHFKLFSVYKLRTMSHEREASRPITVGRDPRITRIGQLLRAMKIDEVPQLMNVLMGDMSLVGPRPEVPTYVDLFREDYRTILSVRPGITDPATLKYCDEGDLLAQCEDPEREYVERILPDKLKIATEYVQRATLSVDATIMLKTLVESVWRNTVPLKKQFLRRRRPLVVLLHLSVAMFANYAAFWLRFDGNIPAVEVARLVRFLPLLVLCRGVAFAPFRLYEGLWRYTSVWDLRNIVAAVGSSSLVFYVVVRIGFDDIAYPRSVFLTDALVVVMVAGGIRLTHRLYGELIAAASPGRRVLIFGAGDFGEMAVRSLRKSDDVTVIGFIDDDAMKVGQRIHGVPVLGTRYQIARIIAKHRPHEVLVAVSRSDPKLVRSMVRALEPYKVPIKTMPDLRGVDAQPGAIRNLTIDDLLTRAPVDLDAKRLRRLIEGQRVLVTGAGGSIGAELARQIAMLDPAALIILDRYENGLYAVDRALTTRSGCTTTAVIADVTDAARMRAVFAEHRPGIVFHAAAHKHVPLMEHNPCEAVKNNVLGTRIVADAAAASGVRRFVLISTDKAVNPVSVMGATKRVAELIVQRHALTSDTAFAIVRFGNVLGSNGSVVPLFLDQIAAGGPVTVTHPDMRRYFMSIREAVQLVLHAAAIGQDGETFVLEMGEQIKLLDLARDLIRLAGFVPEDEIPITYTGIRAGEKLHEEVTSADEVLESSGVEKILRVRSLGHATAALAENLDELERHAASGDVTAVMRQLAHLVPSFAPTAAPAGAVVTPLDVHGRSGLSLT